MRARFYIEDADFSGVEVLTDLPLAQRERLVTTLQLRTDVLGFLIFAILLIAFPILSLR